MVFFGLDFAIVVSSPSEILLDNGYWYDIVASRDTNSTWTAKTFADLANLDRLSSPTP